MPLTVLVILFKILCQIFLVWDALLLEVIVKNVASVQILNKDEMMMLKTFFKMCGLIAKVVLGIAIFMLVSMMVVPPSTGHDPQGLLFFGSLAIFLFSISKFRLQFLDLIFFLGSFLLLLFFEWWSRLLLSWIFRMKGLL